MAMPVVIVFGAFLVVVAASLALVAYLAWRGSKPSDFFMEAVDSTYNLDIPHTEIDAYYELKERLRRVHAPELPASGEAIDGDSAEGQARVGEPSWVHQRVPPEERQVLQRALMRRLVGCIEPLDQVQRDKPGNYRLWRGKLVSERYWQSLCDMEKLISEEIDTCIAEADVVEPGWRDHIFPQAVQLWRRGKQEEAEKKEKVKEKEHAKKAVEKELKRKDVEEKQKEEDKKKQERLAEKAMEKLLREEEENAKKGKAKPKAKVEAKAKGAKKK